MNGSAGEGELDPSDELDAFGILLIAPRNEPISTALPARETQYGTEPDALPLIGASPIAPLAASRTAYDAAQEELEWVTAEFTDEVPDSLDTVFAQSLWQ